MRIVTREQMRLVELNALDHDLTFHRLMENAGSAAAAFIRRTFALSGLNCMVFCSAGNNGGDGFVVARKLAESQANVVVVLMDGQPRSEESSSMLGTLQLMELPVLEYRKNRSKILSFLEQTDIIVDAICGTGFQGALRETHREACRAINEAIAAVVALDIPTGVECDTGIADADAVHADFTIAFDSRKPAHQLALDHCGAVEVVDIGIPAEAHEGIGSQPYAETAEAGDGGIHLDLPDEALDAQPIELSLGELEAAADPVAGEGLSTEPALQFVPVQAEALPDDAGSSLSRVMDSPFPESADPPEGEETEDNAMGAPTVLPNEKLETQSAEAEPVSDEPPHPDQGTSLIPELIDTGVVFGLLRPRHRDSHKGTYGRLLNISGSLHYRGAAVLSTLAALRSGVGLVTLASTGEVCTAASAHIMEATYLPLPGSAVGAIDFEGADPLLRDALPTADAVLIGCGLGNTTHAARLLTLVLESATCSVVVDADGLNALAANIHVLQKASATIVLTPHPGEMARLCGVTADEINRDRLGFSLRFAREHGVVVVLKGSGTLVASPNGLWKNTTGNPGLAKGGSGDVLAGMLGAFLAQGLLPEEAAQCAVHLHGLAADQTAVRRSQYGMLPSELLEDLCGILAKNGR